jgi:hypothetical protein
MPLALRAMRMRLATWSSNALAFLALVTWVAAREFVLCIALESLWQAHKAMHDENLSTRFAKKEQCS